MQEYLEGCLPSGTKWGFEKDTVVTAGNQHVYDGVRLEELIDKLTEVFVDHVRSLAFVLSAVSTEPADYECSLSRCLFEQFAAEPAYLQGEKLRPFVSEEEVAAIKKRSLAAIMSKVSPFLYVSVNALSPACSFRDNKCSLQPKAFHVYGYIHRPSDNFPPMPWFVKLLCNWVWYWSDRNMWRFAPTLNYGVPHSTYLPSPRVPSNTIECTSHHDADEPVPNHINSFPSRRV